MQLMERNNGPKNKEGLEFCGLVNLLSLSEIDTLLKMDRGELNTFFAKRYADNINVDIILKNQKLAGAQHLIAIIMWLENFELRFIAEKCPKHVWIGKDGRYQKHNILKIVEDSRLAIGIDKIRKSQKRILSRNIIDLKYEEQAIELFKLINSTLSDKSRIESLEKAILPTREIRTDQKSEIDKAIKLLSFYFNETKSQQERLSGERRVEISAKIAEELGFTYDKEENSNKLGIKEISHFINTRFTTDFANLLRKWFSYRENNSSSNIVFKS
jgi:hypothetical protein